jgi:flagellum-specific ATP synthase
VSRVRDQVISSQHLDAANAFLKLEAAHHSHEDLIAVGAYKAGADPMVDMAIALRPQTRAFLQQTAGDHSDLDEACARLRQFSSLAAVPNRGDPA